MHKRLSTYEFDMLDTKLRALFYPFENRFNRNMPAAVVMLTAVSAIKVTLFGNLQLRPNRPGIEHSLNYSGLEQFMSPYVCLGHFTL
jgi:hypothetical protein